MGAHRSGRWLEIGVRRRLSETTGQPSLDQRWYGRRHGRKLRPARQALVDARLPDLRISLPAAGRAFSRNDLTAHPARPIWMEIGFGGGEHLAAQAARHPDIGFIGCEPFVNGVASLLVKVEELRLENLRIFDDDVRLLLPSLPDGCIERLFLLFADPWPKARHHRRRITVPENLAQFTRLLADGGELVFASDQHDFAAWSLAHFLDRPELQWTARSRADWVAEPPGWIATRYQQKARAKGLDAVFLNFRRRPRGDGGDASPGDGAGPVKA